MKRYKIYVVEYSSDQGRRTFLHKALIVFYRGKETIVVPFYEETRFHAIIGVSKDKGELLYQPAANGYKLPKKRSDYKIISEIGTDNSFDSNFVRLVSKMPNMLSEIELIKRKVNYILNMSR